MNNILNNLFSFLPNLNNSNNANLNNSNSVNSGGNNNNQSSVNNQNNFNINAYPYINTNFDGQNSQNNNFQNQTDNNQSNMLSKLLPLLISNKGINEILPSLSGSNPLISSILSNTNDLNKEQKIESDKIDVSSYTKIE